MAIPTTESQFYWNFSNMTISVPQKSTYHYFHTIQYFFQILMYTHFIYEHICLIEQ